MSAALARYLKDFSAPPPIVEDLADDFGIGSFGASSSLAFPEIEHLPEIDLEEEKRVAFEEGRLAAAADYEERHAAEIQLLEESHAARLAELEARYQQDLAERLERNYSAMAHELGNTIADQVGAILLPILDNSLAELCSKALAKSIRDTLSDKDVTTMVIRGPLGLVERLKTQLQGIDIAIRHIETADLDLAIELDDEVLVSRLSAWAETVKAMAP